MRWGLTTAVAAALVAAQASPTRAQPAARANSVSEARRLFEEGVKHARASRWKEAHDRFRRSYQAAPRVLTLFNLAGAQRNTLRLVAARASYRLFLEQTAPGRHNEYRRDAKKQIAALGRRIPTLRLTIEGSAAGDVVEVDGRPLEADRVSQPVELDPGPHAILIRRADRTVARRTVELTEGTLEFITLRVPLAATPAPAPDRGDLVAAPPPVRDRSAGRGDRLFRSPWFWGAAAAVAVGAGVGAVLLIGGDGEPTDGTLGTVDVP